MICTTSRKRVEVFTFSFMCCTSCSHKRSNLSVCESALQSHAGNHSEPLRKSARNGGVICRRKDQRKIGTVNGTRKLRRKWSHKTHVQPTPVRNIVYS